MVMFRENLTSVVRPKPHQIFLVMTDANATKPHYCTKLIHFYSFLSSIQLKYLYFKCFVLHMEHNPSVILIRQLGIWDLWNIHENHLSFTSLIFPAVFMLVLANPIKYFATFCLFFCIYLNTQTFLGIVEAERKKVEY